GAFYLERGHLAEAAEAMRAAAKAAPGDSRILDNLGMILQALGREDEALAQFEAAAAGRPALAQPRIRLAATLIPPPPGDPLPPDRPGEAGLHAALHVRPPPPWAASRRSPPPSC